MWCGPARRKEFLSPAYVVKQDKGLVEQDDMRESLGKLQIALVNHVLSKFDPSYKNLNKVSHNFCACHTLLLSLVMGVAFC